MKPDKKENRAQHFCEERDPDNCGKARVVRSIFSFRSFRIPTVGGIWYKDSNFSPLDLEKYHESGFVPYGNGSSTG